MMTLIDVALAVLGGILILTGYVILYIYMTNQR